jgi:serine/threonine protein kinase
LDNKIITNYQADELLHCANPRIQIGPWYIERSVLFPPFRRWLLAYDSQRSMRRWIFPIDESLLQQADVRLAGPSLEWSKVQAGLKLPNFLNFDPPETHQQQLLLIAHPLEGALATAAKTPPQTVASWIAQIARSLNDLHQSRLIHGHIRPDRLWIDTASEPILLRDPIVPPLLAGNNDAWSPLDNQIHPASPINFLAPELSVPGQPWTPEADIYSLGCLWYWLLTGQAPFHDAPPNQIAVLHAVTQLYVPNSTAGGARLAECLKFCLGKNPSTRFANGQALAAAIDIALSQNSESPVPQTAVATTPTPSPTVPPPQTAVTPPSPKVTQAKSTEKPAPPLSTPPVQKSKATTAPTSATSPSTAAEKSPVDKKSIEQKSETTRLDKPPTASNKQPAAPLETSPSASKDPAAKPTEPRKVATQKTEVEKPAPSPVAKVAADKTAADKTSVEKVVKSSSPEPTIASKTSTETTAPKSAGPVPSTPAAAPPPTTKQTPPTSTPAARPAPPTAPPTAPPAVKETRLPPPTSTPLTAPSPVVPPAPIPTVQQTANPYNLPPAAPITTANPLTELSPNATTSISNTPPAPLAPPPVAAKPKSGKKKKTKSASTGKKKKSGKGKPDWFLPTLGGIGVLLLGIIGYLLTGSPGLRPPAKTPQQQASLNPGSSNNNANSAATNQPTAPVDPLSQKFQLIDEDTSLPWAPPSAGDPLSADLLPPEAQAWIFWKPSKFLGNPQGKQLLSVLEADFAPVGEYLRSRSGLLLDDIKQVAFALYPGKEGMPEIATRFELSSPKSLQELKAKWGELKDREVEKKTLLENQQGEAYWIAEQPLSNEQSVTTFTIGPAARMDELVKLEGGNPPMRRQVQQLFSASNSDADITTIFVPGFLFTEGRMILTTSVPSMRESLGQLLATDMQAGMLSSTLQDQWYTELRLIGNSDLDAGNIVNKLRSLINSLPAAVESRVIERQYDPRWGKLSVRYAQMLREMVNFLRINVEDGQAIANFYLPKSASTNLIAASWFAANSVPGATVLADTSTAKPEKAPVLTPENLLDRPMKIAFDQESLEVSLQSIAEAAADGLPESQPRLVMELDYNSMEKEGITQNQQIRQFQHDGKPLREVLTDLVRRANPVVGVTDSTLPDQKLLWVLVDAPDKPGGKMIRITTRVSAAENKLPLTKEFAPKAP